MAELRRVTKGELQLNVIALMYGVSVAEVERIYWEYEKGANHENVKKGKVEFTEIPTKEKKKK